ncbi:hypothetical protein LOD99_2826 [Oopsacas minuta]|uniref:Uncharacterized protein n=1 Tax=Oopsacas minuta TaxID=111878 RepID=A0AAV7K164_9METZ|nr:hypothetical protein LOD99_2826 [Oopsacas minuta]
MEGDQPPRITPIFSGLPTSTRSTPRIKLSLLGVWSAVLFAVSSFALVAVNKIILTSFSFPSPLCLAFGQMVASLLVLTMARLLVVLTLPPLTLETILHIQPLPILYLLNALSGLSSTQLIPLPMFTVLRR